MQEIGHLAAKDQAYSRIGKKVQMPIMGSAPWSPPSLPELVARIDAALDARRAA
ncbi:MULTISPECIES: hypothetical protein [unclassified Sphingomonas]|jgi:hypothetical protein|uniref:hypothetical protein n=1 Tax=unclassified Sphingomonas TaxID=196159 RepID=UPI00226A949E|nr:MULTISPECIES: hypothetical protein [unclassified Sphingomonas]